MKKMRKLAAGSEESAQVDELIADLREKYRRRPRLRQEFDRAGLPRRWSRAASQPNCPNMQDLSAPPGPDIAVRQSDHSDRAAMTASVVTSTTEQQAPDDQIRLGHDCVAAAVS